MPRTVAREVPRWRQQRGSKNSTPGFTRIDGRAGRAYARELARQHAAREAREGKEGTSGGKRGTAARNDVLAKTGAWRFRRHLRPFITLGVLLIAGAILHAVTWRWLWSGLASLFVPALMSGAARIKDRDGKRLVSGWALRYTDYEGLWAGLWLPFLAVSGDRPRVSWLLVSWLPFAALWIRHYGWRPAPPEKAAVSPVGDMATWAKLAAKRKWTGDLVNPQEIPGGRKWEIELDGTETHIGEVMAEPKRIAAAWGKAMTEAYVETHPTGIESKGVLTVLRGGTLEQVQDWDGSGFDEEGVARVGRFADGEAARIRILVPMDGTKHGLIAGTTGAGKSEFLNLLIWLALSSPVPIVPVILDPQNGQSLPMWRDKVLYAAGIDECAQMVRGLHAGMMDRSRRLASMTWDDEGHKTKGLEFFDARLTGLPVVMAIMDEAPLLLAGGGNRKLAADVQQKEAESAKLARKTGKSKWIVAQVPSLGELADQAYRAMLRGSNVVCLRTGEKVSQGMLGLSVDPSSLPQYFPSGKPTHGLGYVVSVDGRQAPFRSDLVPRAMRHQAVEVPALEPEFLEAMDKAMGGVSPTTAFPEPKKAAPAPTAAPRPAPEPEPADDAPEGRRCIDAVWLVLSSRAQDMTRGEVIKWTGDLAETWDRKKWSVKAIQTALGDLVSGKEPGREVTKTQGGVYRAAATVSSNEGN